MNDEKGTRYEFMRYSAPDEEGHRTFTLKDGVSPPQPYGVSWAGIANGNVSFVLHNGNPFVIAQNDGSIVVHTSQKDIDFLTDENNWKPPR